jgi:hypothetical protein
MALYVHYEGSQGPEFTVKLSEPDLLCPLDDVILNFVSKYMRTSSPPTSSGSSTIKYKLNAQCLELRLLDGERLCRTGSTIADCQLAACGVTDIFLVDCPARSLKVASTDSSAHAGIKIDHIASVHKDTATEASSGAGTAASLPQTNVGGVTADSILKIIKGARELCDMRAYKKARELLQEKSREVQQKGLELLSAAGLKITKDCSLHEALAEIFMKTERYENAVDHAEKALEARVLMGPKQSSGSTQRYLNFLLATAHFRAESFEDAWAAVTKTVDACNMKKQASSAQTMGRTYPWFHLDVLALQAEILFGLGKYVPALPFCLSVPLWRLFRFSLSMCCGRCNGIYLI